MGKKSRAKKPTAANSAQTAPRKLEAHQRRPGTRWRLWGALALAVLALAWMGRSWWQGQQVASQFPALVAAGQAGLSRVETLRDEGRGHVGPDQAVRYATDPPNSGPHWTTWVNPGIYTTAPRNEQLVHSLEHGHIVIYYDQPGDAAMNTLRAWVGRYQGQWDGVLAVRREGLGQQLILTAWNKILRLDRFDPAVAAAFIDKYRGRGPENPVR